MHWKSFWKSYSSLRRIHTQKIMTSFIYTEYAELFTWTFWTCASQMHSRPQTCDFSRQHHGAKTQFSPNGFLYKWKGMHMRKLISSFLVTFFSPAGLFPTASLAKHRKPRPQGLLVFQYGGGRDQGRGSLLAMFFFITTTFLRTFLWGVWKIQRR